MTWGIGYYIWEFPYLDYSFDVLISRIGNMSLYNWFSCSYFTYYLISCSYVLIYTIHLSCTHVHDLHATWLYHFVLAGLHLTTLNSHVQSLESGPWWPYYSWSECAADPSVAIGLQQKLGHRHSSSSRSTPVWLSRPLLLLVSISQLLLCISLRVLYFCIFWWCIIPVILYYSLW